MRIGLVVNPIAGIGGSVGLKGSDGAETLARALTLGAVPSSGPRAVRALERLRAEAPEGSFELLVAPGAMGEEPARAAGVPRSGAIRRPPRHLDTPPSGPPLYR